MKNKHTTYTTLTALRLHILHTVHTHDKQNSQGKKHTHTQNTCPATTCTQHTLQKQKLNINFSHTYKLHISLSVFDRRL